MLGRSNLARKLTDFGILACVSLATFYASARVALIPHNPGQGVAVVFAPWTEEAATLSRAVAGGSRFVRFGGLPFIAVVVPDNAAYADRMLGAGAWLVVDPQALAACSAALTYARQSL